MMYNNFSIFLFNNLKQLRKDVKKDIKKILKQIGKELFLDKINKYIYEIVDNIINNSTKKHIIQDIENVNIKDTKNIPIGYKICSQQRTKNRGLCKKICKENENGCIFHKNIIDLKKDENKIIVNPIENTFRNNSSYGIPSGINKNSKNNKKEKTYISNENEINYNINFPKIKQTQSPGQCFRKNNKLYTINYYRKEVIDDEPNGINCYNCKTPRYTLSGPCVNINCKNK